MSFVQQFCHVILEIAKSSKCKLTELEFFFGLFFWAIVSFRLVLDMGILYQARA